MKSKPASQPSIQEFYAKEVSVPENATIASPSKPGDGFTESELAAATDLLSKPWNPEREYEEYTIAQLVPGPRAITFMGRVVRLNTYFGHEPKQPKAAGCHSLIVKDDSAAINIKLYFARDPYPLRLGQLLSVWTAFISDATKQGTLLSNAVGIGANMFPGRVTSDHIIIHTSGGDDGTCRTPMDYQKAMPLPGLMTLDSWLGGGHDGVTGAKILVCVRSIGAKVVKQRKDGTPFGLCDVTIFDHTASVKVTAFDRMIDGIADFKAGQTILLITNPGYKVPYIGNKGSVAILAHTFIDVNPAFPDADWLRNYALGLTKKESVCIEFPEEIWNVHTAETGICTILFTLAELDTWVRSEEALLFTGFLSLTIMEMFLVKLYRQKMLLCNECCGVPVYSETITAKCGNCSKSLEMLLNPRLVGLLVDETGCIAPGKLIWSPRAWEQFFGRPVMEIAEMTLDEMKMFEQRVLFMRLHFVFGWEASVGRLAILGVKA